MNELLREWIEKAEGDYATAKRELRARKYVNYDAVCFHAQQMVEKYLKAFLFKNGVDFPKMHNLRELLELCLPLDASLDLHRDLLTQLDRYAVRYRYPGASSEREEAKKAVHIAEQIRSILRQKLRLHG
ncbi:MAG: HEPN domain-containing protein [Chloroflexota bacterium]